MHSVAENYSTKTPLMVQYHCQLWIRTRQLDSKVKTHYILFKLLSRKEKLKTTLSLAFRCHEVISWNTQRERCRGGGPMVIVPAFYSDDQRLNPPKVYSFYCVNCLKRTKINKKRRGWPIFKGTQRKKSSPIYNFIYIQQNMSTYMSKTFT